MQAKTSLYFRLCSADQMC